jgi:hypothetical protein
MESYTFNKLRKFYIGVSICSAFMLILLLWVAFKVIKLTKCKNWRAVLLVVCINFTTLTELIFSINFAAQKNFIDNIEANAALNSV